MSEEGGLPKDEAVAGWSLAQQRVGACVLHERRERACRGPAGGWPCN